MIKITDKEWYLLQEYATLMQSSVVAQEDKDTKNGAVDFLLFDTGTKSKYYQDGRIPFPISLKDSCYTALPNLIEKINKRNNKGNTNAGFDVYSPKVKKYLKPAETHYEKKSKESCKRLGLKNEL